MVVVIIKLLFIFLVIMAAFLPIIIWVERKQRAVTQDCIGANRADIFGIRILGLFHPIADALKLFTKEDFVPRGANPVLHLLAPVIAMVPVIMAVAVIPYGAVYRFGDVELNLVVADIDWGMLYIFAVGSLAAYGAVIGGWASNNNWSLLGAMRASSQMISYEVTMGLAVVGIFMVYGTLRLPEMAVFQDQTFRLLGFTELLGMVETLPVWLDWIRLPMWGIFLQPLGFILFLACVIAENKRPPFGAPEAESEIVAGYHLEYSGMRFGLFFMSELLEIPVIGMIVATLFLGGWAIPFLSQETIIGVVTPLFGEGFATAFCMALHVATFLLKVIILIWLQIAIRWTLPGFRYDQIMDLCWKMILPLSIANILVTGGVVLFIRGLQ